MRVALNLEQLLNRPPGGIGRYTAELARLLPVTHDDREPVDVVPFVARHGRRAIEAALAGSGLGDVEPVRLLLPRPILYDTWHVLGFPPLGALHRELRDIDLVHAPSLAVPPRSGVPMIVTVHDAAALLYPEMYPRRGRWFHARGSIAAARRADLIIAPSVAAADEISACTPIARASIRVIPQGVTLRHVDEQFVTETRARLGVGDGPYVLWVGTVEPRKNLPVLVEAFRAVVAERDLPHRLVLAGPRGWLDADEAIKVHAERLGTRIHMTGPVPTDQLVALYQGADLFTFPSVHEGFGIPILEAMAQATAVVCSDIPVFHEVAGEAARFAAPGDADAWARLMIDLLRDDGARLRLAGDGRARAAGYTWEHCIDRTRDAYRDVVGAS